MNIGQLGAQPSELLGMPAKRLSQGVDGASFIGQDRADPLGLSLGLGGPRLFARQVAFKAGDPAAQGGDVFGACLRLTSALAESFELLAQRGRALGRPTGAIQCIPLKQCGVVDEHDGHTPLAQPREACAVLVEAVVGHYWRAVVVGDADDPQVAVSLGRRLDEILGGNQAIELASIMVTELMAQGGIDDHHAW